MKSLITHGFSKSQGVNNNCAWFCVTDKKVDVYDLNQFPFVWVAQYLLARELFIVPIWAFLKLAQTDLSDPGSDGREVIMLFNTARCGSTLLCQMFARLPNTRYTKNTHQRKFFKVYPTIFFCRAMSEPWASVVAHTNYVRGKISHQGDDYDKLIEACIRLQCKPELGRKIDRILFKQPPWGSAEVLRDNLIQYSRKFLIISFIFADSHYPKNVP